MATENPFADPLPASPVLVPGYTREEDANITVLCHDRTFKSVTVKDDATDQTLFTVESKGAASLSWRRSIFDGSGTKLFDLRHMGYAMKNDWAVENPEGKRICSLRHPSILNKNKSELDAVIHRNLDAAAAATEDTKIEIRPKDRSALTTLVTYRDTELASMMNTEANDVANLEKKGLDRTVWKAHVQRGVDVSLVSQNILHSLTSSRLCWKSAIVNDVIDTGRHTLHCRDGTCLEAVSLRRLATIKDPHQRQHQQLDSTERRCTLSNAIDRDQGRRVSIQITMAVSVQEFRDNCIECDLLIWP